MRGRVDSELLHIHYIHRDIHRGTHTYISGTSMEDRLLSELLHIHIHIYTYTYVYAYITPVQQQVGSELLHIHVHIHIYTYAYAYITPMQEGVRF
jgi:hypothetical protein